ncbi:hypothetical protein MPTA5024_19495 [Microbispora sp. ATCC PTA-5024]|nr:hypothetical protein MPTA5024_19495 [Microbispora sp. ATCC PTA-5024]
MARRLEVEPLGEGQSETLVKPTPGGPDDEHSVGQLGARVEVRLAVRAFGRQVIEVVRRPPTAGPDRRVLSVAHDGHVSSDGHDG